MKWQYRVIVLPRKEHSGGWSSHDEMNLQEVLDSMGVLHWEFIHMSQQFNREAYVARTNLIFKRPAE